MPTIDYRLGDAGTLGYIPDPGPDGSAFSMTGIGLRLRIATGADYLSIPGTVTSNQTVFLNGVVQSGVDVAGFEIEADTIVLEPRLYPIAVEYDDSTDDGWREFAGDGKWYINVEQF